MSQKHQMLSTDINPSMLDDSVKTEPISGIATSCLTSVILVKLESHDDHITIKEEVVGNSPNVKASVCMNDATCSLQVADKVEAHSNIKLEVGQSSSSNMNAVLMLSQVSNCHEKLDTERKQQLEDGFCIGGCYERSQDEIFHLSKPTASTRVCVRKRPFSCDYCPAKFPSSSHLRVHVRSHTGERPFSCGYCPAKFSRSGNLKVHVRSHTGERPFSCEHCPAKFTNPGQLRMHVRSHTGERPFCCEHCSAKFTNSGDLRRHVRSHTGERPFSCEHCFAKFIAVGDLRIHVRIHTGERPFTCGTCHAKFPRRDVLIKHMRTH